MIRKNFKCIIVRFFHPLLVDFIYLFISQMKDRKHGSLSVRSLPVTPSSSGEHCDSSSVFLTSSVCPLAAGSEIDNDNILIVQREHMLLKAVKWSWLRRSVSRSNESTHVSALYLKGETLDCGRRRCGGLSRCHFWFWRASGSITC